MRRALYAISLFLIVCGVVQLAVPINDLLNERRETETQVEQFVEKAESVNEGHSVPDNPESEEDSVSMTEDIQGIITIKAIGLSAPIVIGTEPENLKKYVGMYEEFSSFGENGVIGLAAHSTSSITPCAHCFFQNIPDLQTGDIIEILWFENSSGNYSKYEYAVCKVMNWEQENTVNVFEKIDDTETLVLQTCTNGKEGVRTYVVAKRIQ